MRTPSGSDSSKYSLNSLGEFATKMASLITKYLGFSFLESGVIQSVAQSLGSKGSFIVRFPSIRLYIHCMYILYIGFFNGKSSQKRATHDSKFQDHT